MSKIDDMIAEYCPNGVEFRELREIFTIRNGYYPPKTKKSYWENGTIPWFQIKDIRENGRILASSVQYVSEKAVKSKGLFPANSILIATSATIGEHALITVPHLASIRFTSLSLKHEFADILNMRFVFYYCFVIDKWCLSNVKTSTFSSVNMTAFKKIKFPIPPLSIQKEIVKVLDAFTEELEVGLKAELEYRHKQYEYYLDKLLSFEEK
jgi:type I restriction enzyme S subunit